MQTKMLSQVQSQHRMMIVLSVREVTLEIKFPCKLRVGMTIGETLSVEEAELNSGLALFNQDIKSQVLIGYNPDSKRYSQKKAIITVYVVSSRGRNVAGIYCIDLATTLNKVNQEATIIDKLQRCPDKQATLSLRLKGFFQEVSGDLNVSSTSNRSGAFDLIGSRVHSTGNEGSRIQRIDYNVPQLHSETNSEQKSLYRPYGSYLEMPGKIEGGVHAKTVEDVLSERSLQSQRNDWRGKPMGRDNGMGQKGLETRLSREKQIIQSDYGVPLPALRSNSKYMIDQPPSGISESYKERLQGKLRDAMENHESERVCILGEVSKLKNQIISDGVYKSRFDQELRDLNNIIQQKCQVENTLRLQLDQAAANFNHLERLLAEKTRQVSVIASKLLELQNQSEAEESRTSNQIQTLRVQLKSQRDVTQGSKLDYLQVFQKLSFSQGLIETANRKCLALEVQIRETQVQNEVLRNNVKALAEKKQTYESQLQRLDGIIQDYSHRLSNSLNQHKASQDDVRRLNQSLGVAIKQNEKDISIWKNEVQDLKNQLVQQQEYYIGQLQRIGQFSKKKQERLLSILESQTNWQLNKVQLQAGEAKLRETLRETENQLSTHKSQVQMLKRTISNLHQEESSLKQELNQLSRNLDEKVGDYDSLSEANETLELTLVSTKKEMNSYKDAVNRHIQSLLRCLFSQSKGDQLSELEGTSDGFYRQETQVIAKVRGCYQELETFGKKLVIKQMQCVDMEQNYQLRLGTLTIDLERTKKLLQVAMRGGSHSPNSFSRNLAAQVHQSPRGQAVNGNFLVQNQHSSLVQQLERENCRLTEELNAVAEQIQQLEGRIIQIQKEAVTSQKELYKQYGETNLMNLRNAQYLEAIRQLEDRIQDAAILQNQSELSRAKLQIEMKELRTNNAKFEQERLFLEQRQRVILEENEFFRVQCSKSNLYQQSQETQQGKVADSGGLARFVVELQAKVREGEILVNSLQENVKLLGDEIENKYSKIYSLETELKQLKGKFRDHSRSRNNLSRSHQLELKPILSAPTLQDTVRDLNQGITQLLRYEGNDVDLVRLCRDLQSRLKMSVVSTPTTR